MQRKKTLYAFLYTSLKEQILTGCYQYGSPLPSASRLCEIYHVGIRTVKDVLAALREEGLIRTEERKTAVVLYRPRRTSDENSILSYVLERRTSLAETFQTIALLMPPLFSFAAVSCTPEQLEHYEPFRKYIQKGSGDKTRRIPSNLFHDLLRETGSLLLNDLYASLEVYAQVPLVLMCEEDPSYVIPEEEKRRLAAVAELLPGKQQEEIRKAFFDLYAPVSENIRDCLQQMSVRFPNIRELPDAAFSWTPERGRDHYYTQISRDLIDKIGTGVYEAGTFLPSEANLCRQYHVSAATVRKALSTLNVLGFAVTQNGRGTIAILPDDQTTFRCMKDETYKRDTLLYLSALQLMAIAIRPAVQLVFPLMDASVQERLQNEFSRPDNIPLASIFDCISELLPLQPLRAILDGCNKLLLWGYYFAFYSHGIRSHTQLKELSLHAFRCMQKGDSAGFSDCLSQCYCHILSIVRSYMIRGGLNEAKKIIIPYDTEESV